MLVVLSKREDEQIFLFNFCCRRWFALSAEGDALFGHGFAEDAGVDAARLVVGFGGSFLFRCSDA
ncbi:MAG: hypothetical protein M2R46_04826 [Verrucomicrobia subdivision 3 bacterium]|nr:hypothetical protein [Limisphaerales bacterium]